MNDKQLLGQFFTKRYEYILKNISIPQNINNIVEPFAGDGDLIEYIKKHNRSFAVEAYDIDPKKEYITKRDTLMNPPSYHNKFIITNPPYLARNRSKNKIIFDTYGSNDLYKCFLQTIMLDVCRGGILIIPLNFLSSTRISDVKLRKDFTSLYSIQQINIFEEAVFIDTSTTVCSLLFSQKHTDDDIININLYPSNATMQVHLSQDNNYTIGGEIYRIDTCANYKFQRLTRHNLDCVHTHIVVKCIDDNEQNQICARFVDSKDVYKDMTPNSSARTYMTLIIQPYINENLQRILVDRFNTFLFDKRKTYSSLFLANYRESKGSTSRKRISFDLVYKIMSHFLQDFEPNTETQKDPQ